MNGLPDTPRVAFQGARGAFSEEAATALFGERLRLVPRQTFESLFAALEENAADCLLAPIENSLAGSVHKVYDLLLESSFQITGEVIIPVSHCLIGPHTASLEQIEAVESHPVALAQCERFFAAHPRIRRIATNDTAASAAAVIQRGNPRRAAIASRRAAEFYQGRIILERLEDHSENYTRFVLLAPAAVPNEAADKLSLVMKLAHRPGALYRALEIFDRRGLDLVKIESRPIRGRPWEYYFYLDLQASINEEETAAALAELRERVSALRILGCYQAARPVATQPALEQIAEEV